VKYSKPVNSAGQLPGSLQLSSNELIRPIRYLRHLTPTKGVTMQNVKVRRGGISASDAADVLRSELGSGYDVQAGDDGTLHIRKGMARAKVSLRAESGGTVFEVAGEGVSFPPLWGYIQKALNNQGIAKKAATAIGQAEAFRDDG
jgi:hypothetical protein